MDSRRSLTRPPKCSRSLVSAAAVPVSASRAMSSREYPMDATSWAIPSWISRASRIRSSAVARCRTSSKRSADASLGPAWSMTLRQRSSSSSLIALWPLRTTTATTRVPMRTGSAATVTPCRLRRIVPEPTQASCITPSAKGVGTSPTSGTNRELADLTSTVGSAPCTMSRSSSTSAAASVGGSRPRLSWRATTCSSDSRRCASA